MTITSCALFIAVDGKQQFHQVILEDEEKKNLVELIKSGALTPRSKTIKVLETALIRTRKRRTDASNNDRQN